MLPTVAGTRVDSSRGDGNRAVHQLTTGPSGGTELHPAPGAAGLRPPAWRCGLPPPVAARDCMWTNNNHHGK